MLVSARFQCGVNPVVVHGGGPQIAAMLKRLDIPTSFVEVSSPRYSLFVGCVILDTAFWAFRAYRHVLPGALLSTVE